MRSYGTIERTEENEQTPVCAQKKAIFSSQRFYGLKKEFREKKTTVRVKKISMFLKQRFDGQKTDDDKEKQQRRT